MQEWRGDHFARYGDGTYGCGDGSARGSVGRGINRLRYVQGRGQGHGDNGHRSCGKDRRQERPLSAPEEVTPFEEMSMKTSPHDVQVLIVDDNPLIRDLICDGMQAHCTVISASDGAVRLHTDRK